MAKNPYLPDSDPQKAIWLNTFNQQINQPAPGGAAAPNMGEYLGLTAAEVTQTGDDAAMFSFCIQNQDAFNNERQERTNYKNLVRDGAEGVPMQPYPTSAPVMPPTEVPQGVFKRISELVARIKASPNYTTAIGEDLGIIGDEQTVDTANAKPVLKLTKVPTGWQMAFSLQSFFDGVRIYRKRPGQNNFKFLATDTRSPYIDTEEQQNGTQYYAYFLLGDDEVGQQSDIVTAEV